MTGPREIRHLPHSHVGRRLLCFDEVASTNDVAAAPGEAILAEVQTAGRGQYGRSWLARPGDAMLLSIRLDPPAGLRRPAVLTAWAAVSVCRTIADIAALPAEIKWPNDILIASHKVCGVLIEQLGNVVVGIGLNLNQSPEEFAEARLPHATSLNAQTRQRYAAVDVALGLLGVLDREYARLLSGDSGSLEMAWAGRLGLQDQEVVAECFDGERLRGQMKRCRFDGIEIGSRLLAPESIRALSRLSPAAVIQSGGASDRNPPAC